MATENIYNRRVKAPDPTQGFQQPGVSIEEPPDFGAYTNLAGEATLFWGALKNNVDVGMRVVQAKFNHEVKEATEKRALVRKRRLLEAQEQSRARIEKLMRERLRLALEESVEGMNQDVWFDLSDLREFSAW